MRIFKAEHRLLSALADLGGLDVSRAKINRLFLEEPLTVVFWTLKALARKGFVQDRSSELQIDGSPIRLWSLTDAGSGELSKKPRFSSPRQADRTLDETSLAGSDDENKVVTSRPAHQAA